MSDYGLRGLNIHEMWFLYQTNVFIILCNDSLDNNSLSSEGISIKVEESIKMLYARIYKLGNFLEILAIIYKVIVPVWYRQISALIIDNKHILWYL